MAIEKQIIECVPNFSEGRDMNVIKQITNEIEAVKGVRLLDVDPGEATNRTVVTFVGTPDEVMEAAFRSVRKAGQLIDMRQHHGAHPRMGATDVLPLIPVAGITLDKSELSMRVGDNPVTLVAKVTPEGATDKTVTWSSSNDRVATVDANGKVKAVGNGTATITATAGGKTATCKLSVGYGVALSKATVGMFIGADGWAYKSRDEATASGTTPEAWIAYKSDKAGESLATSLNHDGTNVNWYHFKMSPGWSSNPSRAAIAGGTWRWPTKADYDKMVPGFCTLKQALGNGVIDRGSYWTKTEVQNSSPLAYCLIFDGRGSYTTSYSKSNIGYCFVRAVLAF